MPPATLLASAILALATAVGFSAVGVLMFRAMHEVRGRPAVIMFATFWASAAIVWATQGLTNLAAYLGMADLALVSALDQVGTPFYCLASASLLYYVLYLTTGRERLLVPILAYYLALFFLLRLAIERAVRLDISVSRWVVNFVYQTPLQSPLYTALVALVALPILASIGIYASLIFRIHEPAARYRVALIAAGLAAWITTEALSFTSGFARSDAGEIVRRLVALASTVVILLAYLPPAFARRRWGAKALPKRVSPPRTV